jgi:hypothetical protein
VVTPKVWHTREASGLRLDRQLRWWHDGEPIEHPNIIEAFNRGLSVTPEGKVKLEFGGDWCFVEVEDAVFAVVALDVSEGDRLSVRLSDRTAELLALPTLRPDAEGVLHCLVKGGAARARFSRDAQHQLGALLEEHEGKLLLRVGAQLVPVPFDA